MLLLRQNLFALCVLAVLSARSAHATEWYPVPDDLYAARQSVEARLTGRQVHGTLGTRGSSSHHSHPSVFTSSGSSAPSGPLYPTNPKALAAASDEVSPTSREKNVVFRQAKIRAAVGDTFSRKLRKRGEALVGAARAVKAKRAFPGRVTMGQLARRGERGGGREKVWKRVLETDDVIVEEAVEVEAQPQAEVEEARRPVAHQSRRSSRGRNDESMAERRAAALNPVKRMEVRMRRSRPLFNHTE